MRVLVLAGLFTAAAIPLTAAAEGGAACQVEDARRAARQRIEAPPPAPNVAQPAAAQHAPQALRRRSGKRIPDAELIGPRGAL